MQVNLHKKLATQTRRVGRRGLTLIETVLTIVILGIAIPPLLALMYGSLYGNLTSGPQGAAVPEARVVATNLIRDKIENLVHLRYAKGYAAVTAGTETENAGSITGFPSFSRETVIGSTDPKQATVTVIWHVGPDQPVRLKSAVVFADPSG